MNKLIDIDSFLNSYHQHLIGPGGNFFIRVNSINTVIGYIMCKSVILSTSFSYSGDGKCYSVILHSFLFAGYI